MGVGRKEEMDREREEREEWGMERVGRREDRVGILGGKSGR